MKNKITILGAGLVGAPMANDLATEHEVTAVDIDPKNFEGLEQVKTIEADLTRPSSLADAVRKADLVINAVPGAIGFSTLKNIIQQGKNVVDIAFYPEDMFLLDDLARAKGVTAICDMGVAPGMSHLLVGYASGQMEELESIKIYVGGLPKEKTPPYDYKAVFSPADVIEEYTRPARVVRNGKIEDLEALSEIETIEFEKVGKLEAFNSDGLRSLIKTMDAPEMIEKTLRYPGHVEKIKVLRDTGFFSKKAIPLGNNEVIPLKLTQELLFPLWKLEKGEADFTAMRVVVQGKKDGQNTVYRWDLYDEYDPVKKTHSMARTTGYAATMAARMVLAGLYDFKGISPPEYVGRDSNCVNFMLKGLRERNVVYEFNVSRSSASVGTGDPWWAD